MIEPAFSSPRRNDAVVFLAPWIFVLIWSTGFVAAKFVLPFAEPFSLLVLRYIPVTIFFVAIALWLRRPAPTRQDVPCVVIVGFFMHFGYFGGVFLAISLGAEAGTTALIAGLQPVLGGIGATIMLGEKIERRRWLGLVLGAIAVTIVIWEKLEAGFGTPIGMAIAFLALLSITIGTIAQKHLGSKTDLWSINAAQYMVGGLFCALPALFFEPFRLDLSWTFVGGYVWIVFTGCATLPLLYLLLKLNAASRVSALFCLVPPLTAIHAALLFGESLGWFGVAGFALAVLAVWLAR